MENPPDEAYDRPERGIFGENCKESVSTRTLCRLVADVPS